MREILTIAKKGEEGVSGNVEDFYNKYAAGYDDAHTSPRHVAEDLATKTMLGHFECDKGPVLDIGCGTGLGLRLLDLAPGDYLGVDISSGMIKQAREFHPLHRFIHEDFESFRGVGFQTAISLFGVINYADDPKVFVRNMLRCIRPGGRFFVMSLLNDPEYGFISDGGREESSHPMKFYNYDNLCTIFDDVKTKAMCEFIWPSMEMRGTVKSMAARMFKKSTKKEIIPGILPRYICVVGVLDK